MTAVSDPNNTWLIMYKFKVLFHPDTTFWFIIYSLKVIPRNNTEENSRNISYKSAESNLLNDSERERQCVCVRKREGDFFLLLLSLQHSNLRLWSMKQHFLPLEWSSFCLQLFVYQLKMYSLSVLTLICCTSIYVRTYILAFPLYLKGCSNSVCAALVKTN